MFVYSVKTEHPFGQHIWAVYGDEKKAQRHAKRIAKNQKAVSLLAITKIVIDQIQVAQ